MKTLLKWTFGIALSVAVLACIGIGLLLFVVNPNNFKPHIEQLAQDNGVTLQIRGDLQWQFLPNIAITVGDTQLSGDDLPEVQFQQADLALDLGKLIGGDIAVNKIVITEPLIRLKMSDANAAEQAAAIAAAPISATQQSAAETTIQSTADHSMALAINSLMVQNGTVELLQNGAVQQRITNLNISSSQLNLEQQPFPISISLSTSVPDIANALEASLNGKVAISQATKQLQFDDINLTLSASETSFGSHTLAARFNAVMDFGKDQLQLPKIALEFDGTPLSASATVMALTEAPNIDGELTVPAFAVQSLLQSLGLEQEALPVERVALSTSFSTDFTYHQLSDLLLTLDDFTLSGAVSIKLANQNEIRAKLKGTTLNLDKYLPEGEEESAEQQPEALFAPLLAPLAVLNGGKGQIEINLEQLTAQGVQLDNLHLNASGDGSVIRVADASASGFGGSIKSDARIDLTTTPKLTFNLTANSVDMGQALTTLADFKELSGNGDLTFSGATSGNTSDELIAGMKGSGNFQLSDLVYSALNIEKQFCAVAGDKEQQPESWPTGSRFDNASSNFTLNGQTLALSQLHTGVGNLKLSGGGNMALLDGVMDMKLAFNINGTKSSEEGCVLRSKSIRNRDLPIHLKGSIDNIQGLITNALVELITKTVIREKADKLLDKLLGPDKDEQDPDNEQPKDSKDQMKDLLKGLLKKR